MVSPQCFPSCMGRDGKFTCLALPGACKTPHNPQLWRTSLHPATHCAHLERMKFDAVCTVFQLRFPVRWNPWTDHFAERDLCICAAKSCWKWVALTATSTRDTGVSVPAQRLHDGMIQDGDDFAQQKEGSHTTVVSPQKEGPIHPFRALK